jgi:hypothetical protein
MAGHKKRRRRNMDNNFFLERSSLSELTREEKKEVLDAVEEAKASNLYISVRGVEEDGKVYLYGVYFMTEPEAANYAASGGAWDYVIPDEY